MPAISPARIPALSLFALLLLSLPLNADIAAAEDESPNANSAATASARKPVRLQAMNWNEVQKLIARHKGKVVVVDIWTTTCPACLKKFPDFVELQKRYKNNVACISVNCDYDGIEGKPPKFYRPHVLKFLRKQNATFDNVLLTISFLDFLNKIDLASTPAMLVYDKTGKLAKRFDNDDAATAEDEFTMKQVEQLVARLVKQ